MADATNPGWDTGHILAVVGGAAAGAALLPVVAPVAIAGLGLAGVASALGVTSVSAGLGAIAGGWFGHKAGKPADKPAA